MSVTNLPAEARDSLGRIQSADIVIGIPSYNNARTIGHVVRAAHAGLVKYFPQFNGVIVNSDGGSKDGTRDAVLDARIEDQHLLLLSTPLKGVHRLSFPYHGIPGKGSAFRLIFGMAAELKAKACVVVDSDLRSITPEWIDLLVRPILFGGFDFVAPYYHRHKFDGTITNSIIYPLTRALYGQSIRQPIGGDFGIGPDLVNRYLTRGDWETDVARFGIDIWMTTIAVAEGFRICQSFLGAKLHDAKDPGSDLSAMFQQVLGSLFTLMEQYEPEWRERTGSRAVDVFGFRFDVGLEPISVNLERLLEHFRIGYAELAPDIWDHALRPDTLAEVGRLARMAATPAAVSTFRLDDNLWTRIVYEFAVAFHTAHAERSLLMRSFTPLYFGRVASFVLEARDMDAAQFEARMEDLCLAFERQKRYLLELWPQTPGSRESAAASRDSRQPRVPEATPVSR
ncbi:MAG: cell wall biosynthesis glycosyltransferase [Bryobacteraceae bacterium]